MRDYDLSQNKLEARPLAQAQKLCTDPSIDTSGKKHYTSIFQVFHSFKIIQIKLYTVNSHLVKCPMTPLSLHKVHFFRATLKREKGSLDSNTRA